MIAVAFRKLVIDEKAAQGLYMFRLGQAVASIIVHERVKAHLDKMDFKYVSWRSLAA
jgi:predicted transcriptional regulator